MTTYNTIPKTLADTPQWLCYKLVDTGKPRLGKPPVSPTTGIICAKNDVSEFTTLTEALVGMERYDLDGVGFVFVDGFVAIDLDDCFDADGLLTSVAQDIYDHFDGTYWEYSPSGNGLHGFMLGVKPNERTKDSALGIEVYSGYNFVTVTGDKVDDSVSDAVDMQDALDWLYETYLPPIVSPNAVAKPVNHGDKTANDWLALGLSKDDKLRNLYNNTNHDGDESSQDFALLTKLTYWLNRDATEIESAFMASPFTQSKDKPHTAKLKRNDYLTNSIDKAISLCNITAYETNQRYETKAIHFFTLGENEDGSPKINLDDYTDLGNALAMVEIFADVLCFVPQWGWCFFNGSQWETDVQFRAMEAAKYIAQGLMVNAKKWVEDTREQLEKEGIESKSDDYKRRMKPANELYSHALKTQSEHGIMAMVNLNKAYMLSSVDSFDTNAWLLNTPQGVVDLKTSELMPHDAKYRLTNMTNYTPDEIPTPLFDSFLDKVFCGDADLIRFAQTLLGSSLVGKVYNENLIIANGTGANGKSTLFSVMQSLLGDYATSIDPDLLMSSRSSEQQVGMAMLENKRFAVAQETEEGQRLRSSMLKRMVSTDNMVAKRLYKDPRTFTPTHTLVLSTNHLPKITSTDTGTWRRLVVLPFNATISSEEMITDFHSVLMEREGNGILNWVIQGTQMFDAAGCTLGQQPRAVLQASIEYRKTEDWISNFITDCCHPDGDSNDRSVFITHADLYEAYSMWAHNNGEWLRQTSLFTKALLGIGWKNDTIVVGDEINGKEKVWYGYKLIEQPRRLSIVQGAHKQRKAQ